MEFSLEKKQKKREKEIVRRGVQNVIALRCQNRVSRVHYRKIVQFFNRLFFLHSTVRMKLFRSS